MTLFLVVQKLSNLILRADEGRDDVCVPAIFLGGSTAIAEKRLYKYLIDQHLIMWLHLVATEVGQYSLDS